MARSGDEGFEQRLDRWVEAGRQFVDGVSGARPGSRGSARGLPRRGGSSLSPGELGRWVENKLEWLLDDESDDDWREPWQPQRPQSQPQARSSAGRGPRQGRRRLEAISRRSAVPVADAAAWPSDAELRVERWQRPSQSTPAEPLVQGETPAPSRPLPRSTRRR